MNWSSKNRGRRWRGFTLIELLVVLVILGLLAGLAGPRVMQYLGKAKTESAGLQIKEIGAALDLFYLDNGRYPRGDEGLEALLRAPSSDAGGWSGPYLKGSGVPKDPWGSDYHYRFPGQHGAYDLYSLGSDQALGGENDKRDVTSWE